MSGDACASKTLEVEVQSNGIIRDSNGIIIGRLSKDAFYKTLGELPTCSCGEPLFTGAEQYIGKCELCVEK
ncbi:hypothetical protein LCGC14_1677990 [marine sediment metagenome]|uniref:Uncharacterized protein n=1 Tax=marine sediment metagenome TaxID=412755 RepID=A0A0F9KPE2_9ZZZZ